MLVTKMDIYFRKTLFLSQSQCHYIVNYILSSMCRTLTRELWNKVHPAIWSKSKFLIRDLISRMKQVIRLAVLIPIVPILTLPFSNVPSLDVNQLFNNERHYWSDVAFPLTMWLSLRTAIYLPKAISKLQWRCPVKTESQHFTEIGYLFTIRRTKWGTEQSEKGKGRVMSSGSDPCPAPIVPVSDSDCGCIRSESSRPIQRIIYAIFPDHGVGD